MHPPVQPGAHRQQRLALPAVRGRQGPGRAADPAQRQGRGGDPRPAGLRAPAVAGGQRLAVPRHDRQRRRLQAVLAQRLHPAAQALAARHRLARRGRAAGHRDRSPVPSRTRDKADQLRRPAARGAKAPRACQPAHDQPLRQDPRRRHPGGARPLPVPAGEHPRPADRLRPRRPGRIGRVGQAQPQPRPRQPPQRLLRTSCAAGLPAPERLPDLPGLPDHTPVPADPPAAGRGQQPSHRTSRGQGTAPPRPEPAPRPGQPGPDHPRPRSPPGRRSPR